MNERKRLSPISLLVLAGLLLAAGDVRAGAWTQSRGHGFYKLSGQVIRANQFYEPDGRRIPITTFGDYTTSFYGEYGVAARITAVAYVPVIKRITVNRLVERPSGAVLFPGDAKTGVADADLGVRIGLVQGGPIVISGTVLLGLPIGSNRQTNGLLTGDGEFNQVFALQAGHSFYPTPLYVTGEVGVNNRSNGYSDEFRYAVECGLTIRQRFLLAVHVRGVESFKNGQNPLLGGMGGLYANNQRYLAYGPECSYRLSGTVGVTVGVDGASRGQNILAAPMYTFGVFVTR